MVAHVLPACIDHRLVVLAGINELVAVLDLAEAPLYPHNQARQTFVTVGSVVQPARATRFSLTRGAIQHPPVAIGANNDAALKDRPQQPRARLSAGHLCPKYKSPAA